MALADTAQSRTARSPGLKLVTLIVLTIAMAAPLFLIQMAANDRQNTASDAARDIASGWGAPQTAAGPFLFVPYTITATELVNGNPVQQTEHRVATLLPTSLDIKGAVKTGERWRGIFKVP